MYAGVGGKGALDAAYDTAVMLEKCKARKVNYTGGGDSGHL